MSEKAKTVFSVTKKDYELTWFSGTGAGGQHRNKHQNCCRLRHKDTGIIKTGQSYRERPKNQEEALRAMAADPRFKSYCSIKLAELERGETIEHEVERMMAPENIRVDVKDENGRWVEMKEPQTKGTE